jgi:hypothetical protein
MKALLLASLTLFAAYHLNAQVTFQKVYGGSNLDYCYDMHKTYDGGYVLGGISFSYPNPYGKSYVVKTDVNGDTLWTASYGDTVGGNCDLQYINDLCQLSDSGYLTVGGKKTCDNSGSGEITRLDKNGNVLWAKKCTPNGEDPYPCIQDKAGNFIVGGYVTGIGAGANDGCLMKLDANGDTLWSRTYGGTGNEWFYHIIQTKDGGYMAAGYTSSFGQGGQDIYIVKTDVNGNLIWSKAYGTAGDEFAFGHCLQATSDGGYILTGQVGSGSQSATGIFLMKIDSTGNMKWANYYSGAFAHAVKQTPDKGYAVVGTGDYGTGYHVVLIKTDSTGVMQWSKTYGGSGGYEEGWILDLANDGGYVTGGHTSLVAATEQMYLVKTDANGNSNCNETNPVITPSVAPFVTTNAATIVHEGTNTVSYPFTSQRGTVITTLCSALGLAENKNIPENPGIYPNPVINNVTLSFGQEEINHIELYDIEGRKLNTFTSSGKEFTFSCSGLAAGLYFIKVTSQKGTQIAKFVKQ